MKKPETKPKKAQAGVFKKKPILSEMQAATSLGDTPPLSSFYTSLALIQSRPRASFQG
jgi:hypothetical protein